MNYSEGEWTVKEEENQSFIGFQVFIESPDLLVAICDMEGWGQKEERLANAHLISAAPNMYEALKMMLEGSEIAPSQTDGTIRTLTRATPSSDAIIMAFNALAKANGEIK
jgi:hypothetical protein